jgi:hypothetical protein
VHVQSSKVMISDAPSESKVHCRSTQGKVFNLCLDNDTINVSTGSHLQIAVKASPVPIRVRWMLVLYGWRSMEKIQNLNDVSIQNLTRNV